MKKEDLVHYTTFQSSFIDFERGIRVGRLEPEARITQLLKKALTERHGIDMICDRWGRGVYWQWICWVPKPNRDAKPISSGYNFASAKFFVAAEREERIFQAGLQIERAPKKAGAGPAGVMLERDWDWHILLKALAGDKLPRLLKRLLREGFRVRMGAFSALTEYDAKSFNAADCRRAGQRFAPDEWGGFQFFWSMPEKEVRAASGSEIIQAVAAVFDEVVPVMNLCMYKPCLRNLDSSEREEI